MIIKIKSKNLVNNLTQEPLEFFTHKQKNNISAISTIEMLYIIQASFLATNDYCKHFGILSTQKFDTVYMRNISAVLTMRQHLPSIYKNLIEKSIEDFRKDFTFEAKL